MFIAMNRFKVKPGREADFESVWRNRDTHLAGLPGFKTFNLLKGSIEGDHTLYSSHTVWESREDFEAWTKSEAFRKAHRNAGDHGDIYMGHPNFEGFDAVL
ncbi:MAG: antibiotic biosynthesis monooxygenase [Pseudomonadota bacterium]